MCSIGMWWQQRWLRCNPDFVCTFQVECNPTINIYWPERMSAYQDQRGTAASARARERETGLQRIITSLASLLLLCDCIHQLWKVGLCQMCNCISFLWRISVDLKQKSPNAFASFWCSRRSWFFVFHLWMSWILIFICDFVFLFICV